MPAPPSDRECRKCLNTRPFGEGAEARLLEPRLARGGAMGPRGRRAVTVAMIVALSSLVVGGVGAAPQSSDESALQPASQTADPGIERKVDDLLRQMTIDEKLQQLQLFADWQITDADARAGVGSVFSLTDPAKINHFQQIAVNESRLHIPILFAYDTIHGYRTIFPVPLGAASSFDPSVATADDTIAARETATVGIKQIYSPMVDVSHEPRWGRIAEAAGEDPYLGSAFAAARVKAAQGTDYSALTRWSPPTCPSSGCATSTCRRSRPRSTPEPAPRCARSTRSAASQGAPTTRPRPISSRASGASTASWRATTPRSPSSAPARPRCPTAAPAATAWRPTGPTRRRPR